MSNSASLTWHECRWAFEWDGSLRDICVQGTDEADWRELLYHLLRGEYAISYSVDGETQPFPPEMRDLFGRSPHAAAPLLTVELGQVHLNCHFFSVEELEFDLDPREIRDEQEFRRLVWFMQRVAAVVGKPVAITGENWPGTPLLSVEPPAVRLLLESVRHGWLAAFLAHDQVRLTFHASYVLSDPVADLARAAIGLLRGGQQHTFSWFHEPSEGRWVLERAGADGNRLRVQVLSFHDFQPNRIRAHGGRLEFEAEYALIDFAQQVRDQIDHLLDTPSCSVYEREYEALSRELSGWKGSA